MNEWVKQAIRGCDDKLKHNLFVKFMANCQFILNTVYPFEEFNLVLL